MNRSSFLQRIKLGKKKKKDVNDSSESEDEVATSPPDQLMDSAHFEALLSLKNGTVIGSISKTRAASCALTVSQQANSPTPPLRNSGSFVELNARSSLKVEKILGKFEDSSIRKSGKPKPKSASAIFDSPPLSPVGDRLKEARSQPSSPSGTKRSFLKKTTSFVSLENSAASPPQLASANGSPRNSSLIRSSEETTKVHVLQDYATARVLKQRMSKSPIEPERRTRAFTMANGSPSKPAQSIVQTRHRRALSEPIRNSWDFVVSIVSTTLNIPKTAKLRSRDSLESDEQPKASRENSFENTLSVSTEFSPRTLRESLEIGASLRFSQSSIPPMLEHVGPGSVSYENITKGEIVFTDEGKLSIKGGTVSALLDYLLEYATVHDRENCHAFLICFQEHIAPKELLRMFKTKLDDNEQRRYRIGIVLKRWLEIYFERDFLGNEELILECTEFIALKLSQSAQKLSDLRNLLAKTAKALSPRTSAKVSSNYEFVNFAPTDFAAQMSIHHQRQFRCVNVWELPLMSQSSSNNAKCKNVQWFANKSNDIGIWVAWEIVSCLNAKKRHTVIKRLINIARVCRDLNNFGAVMALLSGLNMPCVQRLKATWSRIPPKYMKVVHDLELLMNPNHNFANYRLALSTARPPIIPFLAVHQRDIQFIQDGNATFLENEPGGQHKLINFRKQFMFGTIMSDMITYQTIDYSFEPHPIMQNFLDHLTTFPEKFLHKQSLVCEPRSTEQP